MAANSRPAPEALGVIYTPPAHATSSASRNLAFYLAGVFAATGCSRTTHLIPFIHPSGTRGGKGGGKRPARAAAVDADEASLEAGPLRVLHQTDKRLTAPEGRLTRGSNVGAAKDCAMIVVCVASEDTHALAERLGDALIKNKRCIVFSAQLGPSDTERRWVVRRTVGAT